MTIKEEIMQYDLSALESLAVCDIHTVRAAAYYHKPVSEVTKEERHMQKLRDFNEMYGGTGTFGMKKEDQ